MQLRDLFRDYGTGPYPSEALFVGDSMIEPVKLDKKFSPVKLCWSGGNISQISTIIHLSVTPAVSHVVMHAGTNNITLHRPSHPHFKVNNQVLLSFHEKSLADFREAIVGFAKTFSSGRPKNQQVFLLVSEVLPRFDLSNQQQSVTNRISRLNTSMKEFLQHYGWTASVVEHKEYVRSDFNAGGLHLSDEGANRVRIDLNLALSTGTRRFALML